MTTDMRYKLLGRSGLRVSELSLGTMTFGEDWGWGASRDEAKRQFDAYTARGGNFIDTANLYTNGSSEKLVGEFIASDRDRFVVATKYTLNARPGDPNGAGNQRKNMMQSIEASLRRLNTDRIDLYWVHAADLLTPIEEVVRGLDDLVRAGKVLYVGVSDTPAWQVAQAVTLAELRGWTRFVALQIEYSLIERTVERELLPMARALDLAVTPWGALGGGVLTGKYAPGKDGAAATATDSQRAPMNAQRASTRNLAIAAIVSDVAREVERSPAQVALAWVRQQPGVIVPILGARKASQLEDNLAALDLRLSDAHMARLDAASAVPLGFPHEFTQNERMRSIVLGDFHARIDSHHPR
jgi:aryl-alcohol dehydrogenase-like predicted oxidoreductase